VRRPAGQEDHDHAFGRPLALHGLGPQQIAHRQPADGQAAQLQKPAPRHAIAELARLRFAQDGQHAILIAVGAAEKLRREIMRGELPKSYQIPWIGSRFE
jgi:hypothetical protein